MGAMCDTLSEPGLARCFEIFASACDINFGALVWQAMIMPGVRVGHGDGGPGCFTPTHEPAVTNGQLFGWEVCHLTPFVLTTSA